MVRRAGSRRLQMQHCMRKIAQYLKFIHCLALRLEVRLLGAAPRSSKAVRLLVGMT